MTYKEFYAEAVREGWIDPREQEEIAWEYKRSALARFTSEELLRELKERANRKVVQINQRKR